MLIDIYTHIFPEAFYERWMAAAPGLADIGKRMRSVTAVFDLDERFRIMDEVAGDYRQIISLPGPPLEVIAAADIGSELARIANDTMAELVARHTDHFPGFVAALAMLDIDAAMDEAKRAVQDLGAKGVQIYTQIKGRPLDDAEYRPLFQLMADYDLPIWLHPARPPQMPDYATEELSRYELWWALGWPYETAAAMTRLVLSGLFDRHPRIKIITHHCGGMVP